MPLIFHPSCQEPIEIEVKHFDHAVCDCGALVLESDFILNEPKFEMNYKEI